MIGFYIVLTLAVLFVAFMGGVIGYLIGKYWKKKQRMKVRLAKKIMQHRSGCLYYKLMRSKGLDVSKELPKIQQYWEPRWALYYASKGGCYGRVDHRIVKAEKISTRYSRNLMNHLTRLAGKTPFEIRDTLISVNKLKRSRR